MQDLSAITAQLAHYIEPHLGCDLVTANAIKDIEMDAAGAVIITVHLGFPLNQIASMQSALREQLMQLEAVKAVTVAVNWSISPRAVQTQRASIAGVKNIIAVASGKGGVGKSTTTVNLALAAQRAGAKVGILDADIYGPNQPHMLGAKEKPTVSADKKFQPLITHGVQSMSIGYLIDANTPMVWRGPMVSSALMQLVNDTVWHDLDYLFIDLPPGTGDIQLTLSQKVPVAGAVVVTTPQDIALLDARKGFEMFRKVNVPVLGLIENMSTHVCSACGHEEAIFGVGGGADMAQDCGIPLLGQLPLDKRIREALDEGIPTVVKDPEGALAAAYQATALKLLAQLSLRKKNYALKFPNIVVE